MVSLGKEDGSFGEGGEVRFDCGKDGELPGAGLGYYAFARIMERAHIHALCADLMMTYDCWSKETTKGRIFVEPCHVHLDWGTPYIKILHQNNSTHEMVGEKLFPLPFSIPP